MFKNMPSYWHNEVCKQVLVQINGEIRTQIDADSQEFPD